MGCTTAHLLGILQISVAARASLRQGCCSDCVDTCGGGASLWRRRSWSPGSAVAAGSRMRYLTQERPGRLETVAARSGWRTCRERWRRRWPNVGPEGLGRLRAGCMVRGLEPVRRACLCLRTHLCCSEPLVALRGIAGLRQHDGSAKSISSRARKNAN
jgi:hypothetical protein